MEELWDLITEEEYATYQKVSWVKYLLELGYTSDMIKFLLCYRSENVDGVH